MRKIRLTLIAVASLLFMFSSCHTAKQTTSSNNSQQSAQTSQSSQNNKSGKSGKKVKTEQEMPNDRENIGGEVMTPYHNAALDRGEISGEWKVLTINGHEAEGETAPYLLFEPSNGRLYGNNGCNTINGQYDVNPSAGTLRITNLITTMRLCAQNFSTEREINIALDKVRKYTWTFTPELLYTLDFLDENGNVLMTLQRQDFDFLNGAWRVTAIKNEKDTNPDAKLVFDIDLQKLHGNTGCNVINGNITIDMGEINSITINNLISTRMLCPNMAAENALIIALEEVMYARPIRANECQLLNGKQEPVITLVRINDDTSDN